MTIPADILGAVASNAGDEFHEVWALLKAALTVKNDAQLEFASFIKIIAAKHEGEPGEGFDKFVKKLRE